MTNDLARWQFATTSIYHFLFVPIYIVLFGAGEIVLMLRYTRRGLGLPPAG